MLDQPKPEDLDKIKLIINEKRPLLMECANSYGSIQNKIMIMYELRSYRELMDAISKKQLPLEDKDVVAYFKRLGELCLAFDDLLDSVRDFPLECQESIEGFENTKERIEVFKHYKSLSIQAYGDIYSNNK
jgi:hypothetical protein